jgi:hypothetical protein
MLYLPVLSFLMRLDKALSMLWQKIHQSPKLFVASLAGILLLVNYQVSKHESGDDSSSFVQRTLIPIWNVMRLAILGLLFTPVALFGLGFAWGYFKVVKTLVLNLSPVQRRNVSVGFGSVVILGNFSKIASLFRQPDAYLQLALGSLVVAAIRSAHVHLTNAAPRRLQTNAADDVETMEDNNTGLDTSYAETSENGQAFPLREIVVQQQQAEEDIDQDTPTGAEPSVFTFSSSTKSKQSTSTQENQVEYDDEMALDESMSLSDMMSLVISHPKTKTWLKFLVIFGVTFSMTRWMIGQQTHSISLFSSSQKRMDSSIHSLDVPPSKRMVLLGKLSSKQRQHTQKFRKLRHELLGNVKTGLQALHLQQESLSGKMRSGVDKLDLERRMDNMAERMHTRLEKIQSQLQHRDELLERLKMMIRVDKLQLERARDVAKTGLEKLQLQLLLELLERIRTAIGVRVQFHLEQAKGVVKSVKTGVTKLHLQQSQRQVRRQQWKEEEAVVKRQTRSFQLPKTVAGDMRRVGRSLSSLTKKIQKDHAPKVTEVSTTSSFFSSKLWSE